MNYQHIKPSHALVVSKDSAKSIPTTVNTDRGLNNNTNNSGNQMQLLHSIALYADYYASLEMHMHDIHFNTEC